LQLIGQFDSPFVRRVGLALTRYGMAFEHLPYGSFGDSDHFVAHNPLRHVPTLVRDITGISFVQYVFQPKAKAADAPAIKRKNRSPRWLRPLFMLALVSALPLQVNGRTSCCFWRFP